MNLLIIMVDTVRADRIGASGYQRDGKSLTPNLDGLAAKSTYFTRAYSVASNTPRAMPAFMTSRYASQIKVDDLHSNYPILDDSNQMLFESLKAAGFGTFGFSSHYYFQPKRNFAQGFDDYNNDGWLEVGPANHDISAPRIVPRVTDKLAQLGQSKQRFAMWVHLFDPHSTYMEHDGFPPITEHGTEALKQKYDYEIAFEDQWIGKIFDQLAQSGLDKNTVVIMLADHGEAFGVHNFAGEQMFFHGQTLYDELLRIPLIIHVPGVAPSKFDQLVQLIDVAPTILDLFGVAIPSTFQGRSLLAALQGKPLPPKPAFAELISYPNWDHEGRAMISADGKWKLFDRTSDNLTELYDLENDPEERHDLFDQRQDIAKPMEDQLDEFVATTLSGGGQ
jgi:arylsulfatase A-like enzyme